jgi:hypothetical protein
LSTTVHAMIGLLSFAVGNQRMLCSSSKKQDIFLLLAAHFYLSIYINLYYLSFSIYHCSFQGLKYSLTVDPSQREQTGKGQTQREVKKYTQNIALQRKSHLCIPFLEIARPQFQFPHSCVWKWEPGIYIGFSPCSPSFAVRSGQELA